MIARCGDVSLFQTNTKIKKSADFDLHHFICVMVVFFEKADLMQIWGGCVHIARTLSLLATPLVIQIITNHYVITFD